MTRSPRHSTLLGLWLLGAALASSAAARAAESSVAIIDITPQTDPNWRDSDRRALTRLREALSAQEGIRAISADEVDALFREPADPAAAALEQKARGHLKQGRALSARLKPQNAIQELGEALRIFNAIFPYLGSLADLEEVHLQLGVTYQALGKEAQADLEYQMVLLLDPQRTLDENLFSPVVLDRFARVREQAQVSMKGSISLISQPPRARVLMDGRAAGYTPVTIPAVPPGDHYFSLELPGYKTWFGVLELPPGGLEKKEVFLVEGERIQWTRLRNRLAQAGVKNGQGREAAELAAALKADWLLLAAFSHGGGGSALGLGAYRTGDKTVESLGNHAADERALAPLAARITRWMRGDREAFPPEQVATQLPDEREGDTGGEPPPPPRAWYKQWWFWTLVGVAVTGATAGAAFYFSRDRGIQVDVYR